MDIFKSAALIMKEKLHTEAIVIVSMMPGSNYSTEKMGEHGEGKGGSWLGDAHPLLRVGKGN